MTDVSGRHPGKEKYVFSVHFVLHNWEFYSALLGIPCTAFLYTQVHNQKTKNILRFTLNQKSE